MNNKKPVILDLSVKILIIVLVAFIIGIFLVPNKLNYAKGLAFGAIFSILKLKLMESTFNKAVKKSPKKAQAYVGVHYALRYILTALVLVVSALEPTINLYGAVIGIISLKAAAYWQGIQEKPVPKDGSVKFEKWEDDDEDESDF